MPISFRFGRQRATNSCARATPWTATRGSSYPSLTSTRSWPRSCVSQPLPWIVALAAAALTVALCVDGSLNPKTALEKVRNVRVKREADGSTLLHVIAGWNNAQKIVLQLLRAGIPPDERVRRASLRCVAYSH